MKQINYTGSSKLISRIVALLNGKAPLPLDENEDIDWGTSGQVLSTDGSGSTSWVTVSGGGTTYTMSIADHTLTLTDGDGNTQSVSLPDDNTTYTMTINGTTLKLTDSDGTEQTVTIPDTTYSDATQSTSGLMSATDKTKLDGIQSGAEVNVQADWSESDNTSDAYIANKPTIPTVNDATLTIKQGTTTLGTFSANQSTNEEIVIPTFSIDIDSETPTFTEASTRANIASGETISTLFGKIKKFFTDLASVAFSGSYNDLSDKPTIPTVNNATLTIQKNGTTVKTFTANASSNVTANITVPTKTSDISNDSNYVSDASYVHTDNNFTDTLETKLNGIASGAEVNVQADWNVTNTSSDAYIKNKPTLATVATSGAYSDLTGTPTIPTVNNATLTIQKNGTNVQTFTANASSNKTANITVPTKVSELTADVGKAVYYGTCATAAATAAKVVTVSTGQNFSLEVGAVVGVKFTYTNSYNATSSSGVTLNVNSTGAKKIYWGNTGAPTGTNTTAFGRAKYINYYMYDGTYWVWVSSSADNNTTYSNMSANELTTGTATTARSISAKVLTDWLVAKLTNVAFINVDNTFSQNQAIDRNDGTTSAVGNSYAILGNQIPSGTAKNSRGVIRLYGTGDKYAQIFDNGVLTANRNLNLPDASGTIALTSDLTWRYLNTITITDTTAGTVTIPSGVKEILVAAGSDNNGQIFGGKNFVMQNTMPQYDIIVTGELINGSGTIVSTKGVYLGYNSNNTLTYRALDIVSGKTLAMRIYYR